MKQIVKKEYLKMCREKSFLLSKAVASEPATECLSCGMKDVFKEKSKEKKSLGFECLRAISDAKMIIELTYGAKMGAGDTERYLSALGFPNETPLGADQIITNESVCLHHSEYNGTEWVKAFQAYAAATKYGVLILAKTPENFQFWAKSTPCLNEVKGIPQGRLNVYIEHTKDDEGGVQGYICHLNSGAKTSASATVANGKGYLLHADGDYYHGDIKNDNRNGKGTNTYVSGDVYDGDFKAGKMHGKGIYMFANGDIYNGYWNNDKKHGNGMMTYASGDVYNGYWNDDKKHGKGKYTWKNGDVYDGDWKDNKMHGKGKYTWKNGNVYDGDWKDDKMHGK